MLEGVQTVHVLMRAYNNLQKNLQNSLTLLSDINNPCSYSTLQAPFQLNILLFVL